MPGPKQQFLDVFNRERATTLKVMRAFPADGGAFTPHPRSKSAKNLMWTFVQEQTLVTKALDGTLKGPTQFPPEPATIAETIAAFERGTNEVTSRLAKTPDAKLFDMTQFMVGPGKVGDMRVLDLMWMMLLDAVHHRGQLSVYVRLAGGLVPSIYGPSADEPWARPS